MEMLIMLLLVLWVIGALAVPATGFLVQASFAIALVLIVLPLVRGRPGL